MSRGLFSRRRLLQLSGGAVVLGAAGAGASVLACRGGAESAALPLARLFVALGDIPDPSGIGHAVRARFGDDRALSDAALGHPGLGGAVAIGCAKSRRAALRAAFAEDFRAGRVAMVARWVVSEGECLTAGLWAAAGAPDPARRARG